MLFHRKIHHENKWVHISLTWLQAFVITGKILIAYTLLRLLYQYMISPFCEGLIEGLIQRLT